MKLRYPHALSSTRRRSGLALVGLAVLLWFTRSDDWHAIFNDGNAISAMSVASGVLVAALLLFAATRRWARAD
jgi:preprotein translocase subunit Sec61beta